MQVSIDSEINFDGCIKICPSIRFTAFIIPLGDLMGLIKFFLKVLLIFVHTSIFFSFAVNSLIDASAGSNPVATAALLLACLMSGASFTGAAVLEVNTIGLAIPAYTCNPCKTNSRKHRVALCNHCSEWRQVKACLLWCQFQSGFDQTISTKCNQSTIL
jgi:hypothetical protein